MKPDGTDRKQLTFHGTNDSPSWSPDGRYIAFASRRDGTTGIYVMLADGHGKRRLTPKDKEADSPRWSPYLRF
jgi:TolB protein